MSWDPVWESVFKERTSWGEYPPEELVRFIATNYYQAPNRSDVKILEIGCGPGAGPAWYIAREGFSYFGVDGSETAIRKATQRFSGEHLSGEFFREDFTRLPWNAGTFDCVIDIASLQCNSDDDTQIILGEVHRVLKDRGRHFSLTARNGSWGDGTGTRIGATSYANISEGPYQGMGTIRFATQESLLSMYSRFRNMALEYSVRSVDFRQHEISNWIVTCQK